MKNLIYEDPIGNVIYTVDNVLTPDECKELIDLTEEEGFGSAPITTRKGFVHKPEVRNNTRVMLDDRKRADWLFEKVKEHLPSQPYGELAGLNERFRFYRYDKGQYFKWHFDGPYDRSASEGSKLTLMVYLNGECEGGATEFDGLDEEGKIQPVAGKMLVFTHHILHQGAPITSGRKYVLRTDVMYRY